MQETLEETGQCHWDNAVITFCLSLLFTEIVASGPCGSSPLLVVTFISPSFLRFHRKV